MKKLLSALFLLALCSSLAMATVPDPTKCTVQGLLGPAGGAPSTKVALIAPGPLSGTSLTITVRNGSNNVIPTASVQVVFNGQIAICANAVHSVSADGSGVAHINLRGGGCLTGVNGACSIIANGVEILNVPNVRSPDNASHTACVPSKSVAIGDLTFFADEFLQIAPAGCHDYNNSLNVDIADLPYFGDAFVASLQCL
jgi:hypothetical protein